MAGNRRPYGERDEVFTQLVDLTGETNDTTNRLFVMPFDISFIDDFTISHYVAGVGTQDITYTLKTEAAATISATLVKANDGAAAVGSTALGNRVSVLRGTVITLVADFAASVTSGPAIAIAIRVRR
jgi:hypothetical protein